MPNTHPLPWTSEEDQLLYSLYFPLRGDALRIQQAMAAEGFERTESAIRVRFSQIKARKKQPLRMPSEVEMLASHRPWKR